MMEVEIRSASGVPRAALHAGMLAGFSDYVVPMQLSAEAFDFMLAQRGFSPDPSSVALEGDRVVSIWLVSLRGTAAYLISSATDPDWRGKGLARHLAERSLAALARAETFQTEVIEGNAAAERLYARLGMLQRRRLDCYAFEEIEAACDPAEIAEVRWAEIAAEAASLRDWEPSWQNDDAALARVPEALYSLAIRDDKGLAAYAVLCRPSGTLAQIAVRPDRRRQGLGRSLLVRLASQADPLRMLNADGGDGAFARFVARNGGKSLLSQRELHLRL